MNSKSSTLVSVVMIGSIWGFFEATLGGLLHFTHSPISGQIMGPIAFGLLFWGMKGGLKAQHLFAVSLVAASFKFFDAVLFSIPIFHMQIINPAQAIIMQGLSFVVVASIFKRTYKSAAIMVPVSMILFNLFSVIVLGYATTADLKDIYLAIFVKMPIGMVFSMLALYVSNLSFDIFRIPFSWRVATSAAMVALAIVCRGIIA